MKISGGARLAASPQRVWAALNDPAVLVRTIPGCHTLEAVGADEYAATISAGVASIKGTYLGKVRISDRDEPSSYRMHASGSGGPGTVSADALITLAADGGGTVVTYDADAVVGGVIAGVGQRVIAGVAKKTAGVFFGNVDAHLAGTLAAPTGTTTAADPTTPAGSAAAAIAPSAVSWTAPASVGAGTPDRVLLLAAGLAGALTALAGVALGAALTRRR